MARITVVNDNPAFLELVRDILEDERHTAITVDADDEQLVERVLTSRPELLIVDLRIGASETLDGWQIVEAVRAESQYADLPVLICSADLPALDSVGHVTEPMRRTEVLAKPFSLDELDAVLERLLAEPGG